MTLKRIVYIAAFPVAFTAVLIWMERDMNRAMRQLGWRVK